MVCVQIFGLLQPPQPQRSKVIMPMLSCKAFATNSHCCRLQAVYSPISVKNFVTMYRGSPTSTVSTSTISTSTNIISIGIKFVLVEFLCTQYVVKFVLVEIGYAVLTSTNFAQYDFFPGPKNRTKRGPPVTLLDRQSILVEQMFCWIKN